MVHHKNINKPKTFFVTEIRDLMRPYEASNLFYKSFSDMKMKENLKLVYLSNGFWRAYWIPFPLALKATK